MGRSGTVGERIPTCFDAAVICISQCDCDDYRDYKELQELQHIAVTYELCVLCDMSSLYVY